MQAKGQVKEHLGNRNNLRTVDGTKGTGHLGDK